MQDRRKISGAILPTLEKPLFVATDKKGAFYFYKPFKDKKGVLNLVSVSVDKENKLSYKTSYIGSKNRLEKIINEYNVIYEAI